MDSSLEYNQNILEEDYDENYEPTDEGNLRSQSQRNILRLSLGCHGHPCFLCSEILEYCKILGLDPVAERDLLYIAKEGIKAPLPKEWRPM